MDPERNFAMIPTTSSLFDLSHTLAAPLLEKTVYPWEALDGIRAFVLSLGETLSADEYDHPQPDVWIAKDVKIAPTASITGPCIIGKGTEVRPVRIYPRQCSGRGGVRNRQLDRTEKRNHF